MLGLLCAKRGFLSLALHATISRLTLIDDI
jgi:hypothetical protein